MQKFIRGAVLSLAPRRAAAAVSAQRYSFGQNRCATAGAVLWKNSTVAILSQRTQVLLLMALAAMACPSRRFADASAPMSRGPRRRGPIIAR
jgi:hypothetical protein